MGWALIVVGIAADVGVRSAVAARKLDAWVGLGILFPILGVLALVGGWVTWAEKVSPLTAFQIGAASAVAFFILTRFFLVVIRGWKTFSDHMIALYAARENLALPAAVGISVVVAAGEELFWRGLVQGQFSAELGIAAGAAIALSLNILTTVPQRSLPITIGTAVGALLWTTLAVATGGVLASLVCHTTWTAAMLAWPPPAVAKVAA